MTRTPPPRTPTPAAFLSAVTASGLGPPARKLADLVAALPDEAPVAVVAHHLVVRGVLTRFQADRLMVGDAAGLALGPYLLLEPVGEEDGGRLYRGRHRLMNRLVGVWVAGRPACRERLAAARAAARLAHPHIVTVLDVDADAARPFVVSEHVDGAGLAELVGVAGRLPVWLACDLTRQVALGLAHAHAAGIAHGRLAPACVRVGHPGGGHDGPPVAKLDGFAGGPADADSVCGDLLALGRLAVHLLAGRPDAVLPTEVPAAVVALLGELTSANPYRRPAAGLAADRLAPFTEFAGAEPCPFADLGDGPSVRAAAVVRRL